MKYWVAIDILSRFGGSDWMPVYWNANKQTTSRTMPCRCNYRGNSFKHDHHRQSRDDTATLYILTKSQWCRSRSLKGCNKGICYGLLEPILILSLLWSMLWSVQSPCGWEGPAVQLCQVCQCLGTINCTSHRLKFICTHNHSSCYHTMILNFPNTQLLILYTCTCKYIALIHTNILCQSRSKNNRHMTELSVSQAGKNKIKLSLFKTSNQYRG